MIRRTQETDAQAIAELDGELFPTTCWNENSVKREIKLGWSLVATDSKGRVVGYLLARLNGDIADIIRVGVTKKHQRKGHGRAMVLEAIERIAGRVMLTVRRDNEPAKALYKSLGFQPTSMIEEEALILVRDSA